jgi:hypothetical protein
MDRSLIEMIMENYNKISTNGEEKGGVLDRTMDRSLLERIMENYNKIPTVQYIWRREIM